LIESSVPFTLGNWADSRWGERRPPVQALGLLCSVERRRKNFFCLVSKLGVSLTPSKIRRGWESPGN